MATRQGGVIWWEGLLLERSKGPNWPKLWESRSDERSAVSCGILCIYRDPEKCVPPRLSCFQTLTNPIRSHKRYPLEESLRSHGCASIETHSVNEMTSACMAAIGLQHDMKPVTTILCGGGFLRKSNQRRCFGNNKNGYKHLTICFWQVESHQCFWAFISLQKKQGEDGAWGSRPRLQLQTAETPNAQVDVTCGASHVYTNPMGFVYQQMGCMC